MDAVLPSPFELVALDSVDSTSEEAKRRAAAGAADSTVVWALEQSAGKGRMGRNWVSDRGNLYASVLLRPNCQPEQVTDFTFIAANAVAEAVAALLPNAEVSCKWPNDILVNGRKVAGILLESELDPSGTVDLLVIGIGINVHHHPDDDRVQFPATDLNAAGAPEVRVGGVLEGLCAALQRHRKAWERSGFAPVREVWMARAYGLNEAIEVRLPDRTAQGTFTDLDGTGALILEKDGTEERILAGDVFPAA